MKLISFPYYGGWLIRFPNIIYKFYTKQNNETCAKIKFALLVNYKRRLIKSLQSHKTCFKSDKIMEHLLKWNLFPFQIIGFQHLRHLMLYFPKQFIHFFISSTKNVSRLLFIQMNTANSTSALDERMLTFQRFFKNFSKKQNSGEGKSGLYGWCEITEF